MEVRICHDADSLGAAASRKCAQIINRAIAEKEEARIILSTGASQFETLSHLVAEYVDWSKVTMFHLDEYHLVEGRKEQLEELSRLLCEKPIDLGLIGIGENGHIAFNDPPCDFDTQDPYIIVNLSDTCKRQQVGEGWFANTSEVPLQAVSMSCRQILKCLNIVSAVPHKVKAEAVRNTLYSNVVTNTIPATLLKTHENFSLFLDEESASLIDDFNKIVDFSSSCPILERE